MKSLQDLDRLLESMDVAVRRFTVEEVISARDFAPPPPGAVMLVRIVSGRVRVVVADRADALCREGALILVPPGLETRLAPVNGDPARIAIGAINARLSHSFGLLDRAKVPIIEDMSGEIIVAELCALMISEADETKRRLGARALLNALMKTTILIVLRRFFRRPGIDQKIISELADPRLAGAVAEIIDRAAAPHSVASLAECAGLSASTFARLFTFQLGMTPMEFVARARMHRAAELLRTTEMPVKVVAAKVGFASRSHFSKAFQVLHGSDPTAYRGKHGSKEEQAAPVEYREMRNELKIAPEPAV